MLKNLIKGALVGLALQGLDTYRRLSVRLLKIEVARGYIHGVRVARLSAIGLMRMGLATGAICIGALLLHGGVLILLPWSVEAKALLCILLGLVYAVAGGVALLVALNEKKWMRESGAAAILAEAAGQAKPDDLATR